MYYAEILLGIGGITGLIMGWHLARMKTHDRVLYKFCQVRRDIMELFRRRGFELHKQEYSAMRQLLEVVDSTIHDFNKCKSTIFNIRTLAKLASEFRSSTQTVQKIMIPTDPEAVEIVKSYKMAMIGAFLAYTPFIKSELLLKFVISVSIWFLSTLEKLGLGMVKQLSDFEWMRDQFNHHQHA